MCLLNSQQCKENATRIQVISLYDTFRWLQTLSDRSVVQPVPIYFLIHVHVYVDDVLVSLDVPDSTSIILWFTRQDKDLSST